MKVSAFKQRHRMWDIVVISFISMILTACLIFWVLPRMGTFLEKRTTNELIAIVAVIVTAAGVTWPIITFKLKYVPKLKTDLSVEGGSGNFAIIRSKIENCGGKKVTPYNVYLFIDEGVLKERGYYEFPFLLKHEGGEYDCVLSKICQREGLSYPRDLLGREFQNIHTDCLQLRNLSSESILYIAPEESFSQDVTVKLPHPGVYRAIFVFTAQDADCICASKQFIVQAHKNHKKEELVE